MPRPSWLITRFRSRWRSRTAFSALMIASSVSATPDSARMISTSARCAARTCRRAAPPRRAPLPAAALLLGDGQVVLLLAALQSLPGRVQPPVDAVGLGEDAG